MARNTLAGKSTHPYYRVITRFLGLLRTTTPPLGLKFQETQN